MLRTILSALCVFALAGFVTAEEKKGTTVTGKFDSYKDGKLTIKVGKGDDAKAQTFDVKDDVKTMVYSATDTKPTTAVAKDAFKELKAGTTVKVMLDDDKKVTSIEVGDKPKK